MVSRSIIQCYHHKDLSIIFIKIYNSLYRQGILGIIFYKCKDKVLSVELNVFTLYIANNSIPKWFIKETNIR